MNNLLIDLWYGQIHPSGNSAAHDEEVKNLVRLIEKNQEQLDRVLDTDGKKRLDNYVHCYGEYTNIVAEHAFCDGFSLACRLLTAAFGREN